MIPIRLKKDNKDIILFQVTDIMGKEGGCYSYHIIDENKEISNLDMQQIRGYKFIGFVKIRERKIKKFKAFL